MLRNIWNDLLDELYNNDQLAAVIIALLAFAFLVFWKG